MMKVRAALPTRPIPELISGNDTTAQAEENRARVANYIVTLKRQGLPLPADPTRSDRLGIAQVGREAGVCIGVLRPGSPLRLQVEACQTRIGLAAISKDGREFSALRIDEAFKRLHGSADQIAGDQNMSHDSTKEALHDIQEIMTRRAGGCPDALVAPVLLHLNDERKAGKLDLPGRLQDMLPKLESWIYDRAASTNTVCLDFPDAIADVLRRIGATQTTIAADLGIKSNTISRWLTGRAIPNARSFENLRTLSAMAGRPDNFLVDAAWKFNTGPGPRLSRADVPEQFRSRSQRDVVADAKARLEPEDYALTKKEFQTKIAVYCEEANDLRQTGRNRHKLRVLNRIDRSGFSPELTEDINNLQAFLRAKGLAPPTVDSYTGLIESGMAYALSDRMPAALRLHRDTARLSHLASPLIWRGYFGAIEDNAHQAFNDPSHKICRATVERLKAVESMFDPIHGFIQGQPDLVSAIADLGAEHLYFTPGTPPATTLLFLIKKELGGVRREWMKRTKPPTPGKSEIADLLTQKNPINAVTAMIMFQRTVAHNFLSHPHFPNSIKVRYHFATAMRKLIVLQLLAQTALRIGMLPNLTVGTERHHHLRSKNGDLPLVRVPANLFKNKDSMVFKNAPYKRQMENRDGFREDFQLYMRKAQPILLGEVKSDVLFPVKGGHPILEANLRSEIYNISSSAIGRRAPVASRMVNNGFIKPHHFRDILATQILHDSDRNYAFAADAIHVTEQTCREHYAHDTPEMRQPELQVFLRTMGKYPEGQQSTT